jgi:pilus assembly protein CpaE
VTAVIVASADQSLAFELRSALQEIDGIRVEHVADSTAELVAAVLRLDPDVVLVHDELGPDPAMQVVRDLALRRPTCALVIVTATPSAETFAAAMEAGARGVVAAPVSFEDLRARVEAAAASAQNMRQLMASATAAEGGPSRARVVCIAGAKGGVGTTTLATHLALDVIRTSPTQRVCLVDLDLEKGDVGAIIEVRHRASIADVAKVAADLSARAVGDAVVVHESGLHLLLTPGDVRDVEAVSPRALREIVAVLRQEYDVVVIDAGAHVTPSQATAVELADEVVVVTTPDVLAMRGLRRTIAMWEGLAVRKEGDVRVLVNRASRQASLSPESVRQLTRAAVLPVAVPAMFRRIEPAINARDPYSVREGLWWRALRAVATELGIGGHPGATAGPAAGERKPRRGRGDRGSVVLELVGILPVALVVLLLCWQVALYGMSAIWAGHAASVAARAASVGADPGAAVRADLPAGVAGDVTVTGGGSSVTVVVRVPMLAPRLPGLPVTVSSTRGVVSEP